MLLRYCVNIRSTKFGSKQTPNENETGNENKMTLLINTDLDIQILHTDNQFRMNCRWLKIKRKINGDLLNFSHTLFYFPD